MAPAGLDTFSSSNCWMKLVKGEEPASASIFGRVKVVCSSSINLTNINIGFSAESSIKMRIIERSSLPDMY
jgi:hypothetical protein